MMLLGLPHLRCAVASRSARSRASAMRGHRASAATPRATAAAQPEGLGHFAAWVRRRPRAYCRYALRPSPAHAAKSLRRSRVHL